ncbi:PP-loop family protein [uncultured Desulfobacterium sp.]|uniref:PP-loop family protein n=1 Tax=uncultured Desulfobacterium sp. TaxID=201089 RepID=A0A445N236_9BACT|nr:PP-loop family protein [uncultured Desulfobacterium sp.]
MGFAKHEMRRLMGRAINGRNMIKEGDHVLVAVSGGKDSLALLWLLKERLRRMPVKYRLTAIHVDPGFGADSAAQMEDFFKEHGFDYRVIRSDIGPKAHQSQNRENPCFVCSRLRRKLLFNTAAELGCNLLALGHHKDDLIETFFLNVFYSASISTIKPVQELFDGRLTIIRPLFLIDEGLIERYVKSMGWSAVDLGCPTSGSSKREQIKNMLKVFYGSNRKVKGNIFHALQNVNLDYLP